MVEIKLGDYLTYIGLYRSDFTYNKRYKIIDITYDGDRSCNRYWVKDDQFDMRSFFEKSNLIPNYFILATELRRQKLKKLNFYESSL